MRVDERAEIELLLRCARSAPDADSVQFIQESSIPDLDWGQFAALASSHQVLPLVYWNLVRFCADRVPRPLMEDLRRRFEAVVLTNLARAAELRAILESFREQGIPVVPFKGPTVGASLYGSPALRTFGDLDILVRRGDVDSARDLLLSQGYRIDERRRRPASKHFVFIRPDCGSVIELHWAFFDPAVRCRLDIPRLWSRVREVQFYGTPVLALDPKDEILILAVHGASHGWPILKWVCDIAEFLRVYPDLDWQGVLKETKHAGSGRMLLLGLALAADLLGANLSPEVQARLDTGAVTALARDARDRLFARKTASRDASFDAVVERAQNLRRQMDFRERPLDRVALCWLYSWARLKAIEAEHDEWRFGRRWKFLSVAMWPVRLIQVYGFKPMLTTLRVLLASPRRRGAATS